MRKLFENNLLTKLLIIISIKFYFYYRMFHRFMTSSKYIVYKSSQNLWIHELKKYTIQRIHGSKKSEKRIYKFSNESISEQRFPNKLMHAFLQISLSHILYRLVKKSIPSLRARSFIQLFFPMEVFWTSTVSLNYVFCQIRFAIDEYRLNIEDNPAVR